MITAMQSARHKAADHLRAAKEHMREITSLVCWRDNEAIAPAHEIIKAIDALYAKLIPNRPAD